MGQNWKTLGLVVVGAAIAGWVMVRVLSGGANRRVASPTPAIATIAGPQHTAATIAAANMNPSPVPAASATPPTNASAPGTTDEATFIERDLGLLAQGLLRDRQIEDRVMPLVNDVMNMPRLATYRRALDFWESAGMNQ
jgi:hypothetical protein